MKAVEKDFIDIEEIFEKYESTGNNFVRSTTRPL